MVSFNWTEWIFRNSLHDTQDPITGQCFPFKVSNVEGMGRFVTFPNTLSIQTCASVHGTYHSAMAASHVAFYLYFYRTRVRSLAMLVTHSLTHSLTEYSYVVDPWLIWPWELMLTFVLRKAWMIRWSHLSLGTRLRFHSLATLWILRRILHSRLEIAFSLH